MSAVDDLAASQPDALRPAAVDQDLLHRRARAQRHAHLARQRHHVLDDAVDAAHRILHPLHQVGVGDQAVHRQRVERRQAQEHRVEGERLAQLVGLEVFACLGVQVLVGAGLDQARRGLGIGQIGDVVVVALHEVHAQLVLLRALADEPEQPRGDARLDPLALGGQLRHAVVEVDVRAVVVVDAIVRVQGHEFDRAD